MNLFLVFLLVALPGSTIHIPTQDPTTKRRSDLGQHLSSFHNDGHQVSLSHSNIRSSGNKPSPEHSIHFRNNPYTRRKQKRMKSSKIYFGPSLKVNRPSSQFRELYGRTQPRHPATYHDNQLLSRTRETHSWLHDSERIQRPSLKVIPGHTHLEVKIVNGENGHRVVLSSTNVGHQIIISPDSTKHTTSPNVQNLGSLAKTTIDSDSKNIDVSSDDMSMIGTTVRSILLSENSALDSRNTNGSVDLLEGSGDGLASPTNIDHINLDSENEVIVKSKPISSVSPLEINGEIMSISANTGVPFDKGNGNLSSGRILNLFAGSNDTCTTPKDEPGHCRNVRDCLLPEVLNNFNMYLQYMCMIRSTFVGICCPDNPVVEVINPDENLIDNKTEEKSPLQPKDGCGLNSKTRIVGGKISNPHEWTWMVALLRRNRFFCGGVLINNLYVLTAAHCTLGIKINDITVRLGEYDFNDRTKHQEDIQLSEIKRHAMFATTTFQHDIALLKLRRPISFSRFIGTICLPKAGENFTDVNATVVGWGTVSFGGAASSILRQVTVPVWDNKDCDRTYALENINDGFLCAGSPDEEQDACQGDSGGPLMSRNDQGRWQVIGLVSWGRRCGDPNYPGVYTRVTSYLDWIQENISIG